MSRNKFLELTENCVGMTDGNYFTKEFNKFSNRIIPLNLDWCAMFVSVMARRAGIPENDLPTDSGCTSWRNKFKSMGVWKDKNYTPSPGDLVFFDWDLSGDCDHVGIVVETNGKSIKTIEGNAGNPSAVRLKIYGENFGYFAGFANIQFEEKKEEKEMNETEIKALIKEEFGKMYKRYMEEKGKTNASAYAKEFWEAFKKSGVTDGTAPRTPIERQDCLTILGRIGLTGFSEKKNTPKWAKDEYEQAINEKITDGTKPLIPASRLETALMNIRTHNKLMKEIEELKKEISNLKTEKGE